MDVPMRSAADLARVLGVNRQRLNPYVRRARVEPVGRSGPRLLYDEDAQRRIIEEYHEAQLADPGRDWRERYAEGLALYRAAAELGLLRAWLADQWLRFLVKREEAEALLDDVAEAFGRAGDLPPRERAADGRPSYSGGEDAWR